MSGPRDLDLLGALGYAVFERVGSGEFRIVGEAPGWLESFPSASLKGGEADQALMDVFPFLEVFLQDADAFWGDATRGPMLRSDYWTETGREGEALPLCASAVVLPDRGQGERQLLLIEFAPGKFQEAQMRVHHAHTTSLAYDQIAKLSRELERATEAKTEFLARMSHEIRTPMNALLGMAELLGETELTEEQTEYVRIFRRAGDKLLDVVNDILDFSKVEAGQVELENIPFDLADVIEQALEVMAVRAHAKGLGLSCRIERGVPVRLTGDPGRLRQVILNLLGNAIKFTDRGGVWVKVSADPNDAGPGWLHFTISDSGVGIPADRISTIFESFTQADVSTTRKFGGTGLGLAISKRFVELMGGKIWAESTLGSGSTMHFTARFGIDAVATRLHGDDMLPDLAGRRCLVVDQDPHHCEAVADVLEVWGAQVSRSDGSTLDEIRASGSTFDLALVDARPTGDGDAVGLAARIKEEKLAQRVIVMLTTDRLADVARCGELGLGHLLKPVRRSELRKAIEEREPGDDETTDLAMRDGKGTPKRTLRILLADDSEDNRFLIRGYLKGSGYTIEEAENGAVAVEKFKQGLYDLVLTDVEMPVLDGLAATFQMRDFEKQAGRPQTPILALSAHAFKEASQRSAEAGCTGHLTKPIKMATLLAAIRPYERELVSTDRIEVAVEEWLKPVAAGYIEKRKNDVVKLRTAVEAADYATVRMLGHQMSGTGASYGFDPITRIGSELEQAALSGDVARMGTGIGELEGYLDRVDVA